MKENKCNNVNKATLNTEKNCIPDTPQNVTAVFCKETSLWIRIKKGSLCVETALILPIFLFAIISLLYFSAVIQYTNSVEEAIHQTVRDMAIKEYAIKTITKAEISGKASGVILSETYVRSMVNNYLNAINIKPGKISFVRSSIDSGDIIDVIAEETIELPYSFLGIGSFNVLERGRVHAWTGYDGSKQNSNTKEKEEIVYITSKGSVYHRSKGCSHLKVVPKSIASSLIKDARSSGGSKYYPCEYCGKKESSGIFYITDYGNRYHTSINCGALTRDIEAIPISKVGSRRQCKDCA